MATVGPKKDPVDVAQSSLTKSASDAALHEAKREKKDESPAPPHSTFSHPGRRRPPEHPPAPQATEARSKPVDQLDAKPPEREGRPQQPDRHRSAKPRISQPETERRARSLSPPPAERERLPQHYLLEEGSRYEKRALQLNLDSRRDVAPVFEPAQIAVIGGGIGGCLSALQMAQSGHRVTIYEAEEDICMLASKIPAHLYGGGPGYCHLPAEERDGIFRSSLEFAKLLPQAMNARPTVFAFRTNDKRTAAQLVDAAERQAGLYREMVRQDPSNAVFGPPDSYLSTYSKERVLALRSAPALDPPTSNDHWMGNWARQMTVEALDGLQWPIAIVMEPGINMFRARECLRQALTDAHVTVQTGTRVSSVHNLPSEGGMPGKVQIGAGAAGPRAYDYMINTAGLESGWIDDAMGKSAPRSIDVKFAGVIQSSPEDMRGMPQCYIMGSPMVHVTPYSNGMSVINVTTNDCTYVKGGKVTSKAGEPSDPVLDPELRAVVDAHPKDPKALKRVENMLVHLRVDMPGIASRSVPHSALGGYVPIAGADLQARHSTNAYGPNAVTFTSSKATAVAEQDVPSHIAAATLFGITLGPGHIRPATVDSKALDAAARAKVATMGLPPGASGVFGSKERRLACMSETELARLFPTETHERLPVQGSSPEDKSSAIQAAYMAKDGTRFFVIHGNVYRQVKQLGVGFGGEAFLFEDVKTGTRIVVKLYFEYRSMHSKGDMDREPPKTEAERTALRQQQDADFHTERGALEKIAGNPADRNLAHPMGFGKVQNRHCIVMPYYDGGSVRELLQQLPSALAEGRITPKEHVELSRYILAQILSGMSTLRDQFVHRDLKADNVLLEVTPILEHLQYDVRVKIADFGTSSADPNPTATVVTTPQYKSPEYIAAERAGGHGQHDQAQDIWSLGITAVELLAGTRPFDIAPGAGATESAIYDQVQTYAAGGPLPVARDCPLRRWIDVALARDPAARSNPEALLRLLEQEGGPIDRDCALGALRKLIPVTS